MIDEYTHLEHRHRFACWAAARAAQRSLEGATVEAITRAINSTDLLRFVSDTSQHSHITAESYDRHHRHWCAQLKAALPNRDDYSFGRLAKIIAIYLKTMAVINPNGPCNLAYHAHPPIDNRLLTALSKCKDLGDARAKYRSITWTKMNEEQYVKLILSLRTDFPGQPMWKIEHFWSMQG